MLPFPEHSPPPHRHEWGEAVLALILVAGVFLAAKWAAEFIR